MRTPPTPETDDDTFAPPSPAAPVADSGDPPKDDETPLWLRGVDAATLDLFNEQELRDIYETNLAKAKEEKKKAALKKLDHKALTRARIEEGIYSPRTAEDIERDSRLAEMVRVTINMPRFDAHNMPEPIIIDGKVYEHGLTYPVPRATYNDIAYLMNGACGAWRHYAQFKGDSSTFYSEMHGRMVHPGGLAMGSAYHAGNA